MERVTEERTFRCEGGVVALDVLVGEGQTGAIAVDLDGAEIAEGVDRLEGVELGSCPELAEADIAVRVAVNVVHGQSGRTSVTVTVRADGGEQAETFQTGDLPVGTLVLFTLAYTREAAS